MFLRWLYLGAALSAAAFGQSLSPTSCSITGGVAGWSTGFACQVQVTATGAWTATNSTSTGIQVNVCRPDFVNQVCPVISSGNGNDTLRVYGVISETQAAGTFSKSVVIAGITLPVTVIIGPHHYAPLYFDSLGHTPAQLISLGCSRGDSAQVWTPYVDKCPFVNESPGGNYTIPTIGNTFTDPLFGTTILHLADADHRYSGGRLCSNDVVPLCSVEQGPDTNAGFYLLQPGLTTFTYPYSQAIPQFYPTASLNSIYGIANKTFFRIRPDLSPQGIYRYSAPSFSTGTLVWTSPIQTYQTLVSADQAGITNEGWTTVWGCLAGQTCGAGPNGTDTMQAYRYIYAVNLYTGKYVTFDMQDPRVTLNGGPIDSMSTREVVITNFDRDGWAYIYIMGAITPNHFIRFKRDGTWQWLGPRFTSTFSNSGNGSSSAWGIRSDCPGSNIICIDGGHLSPFTTGNGGYTGVWHPYNNIFNGAKWFLLDESLNLVEGIESGGGGPAHLGGATFDHPTCAASLPLCGSAWEAAPDIPATNITSVTGTNVITLADSGQGTLTTSNFLSVGCNQNAFPGMYGRFAITNVAGLNITLGSPFNGTGYSTANHHCEVVKDQTIDHSHEEITLTRFDRNGFPMQVWRVSKVVGIRSDFYNSEAHTQLTSDGTWVWWGSNIGYPNQMVTLAAQTPWQMLAQDQEELAPGYRVQVEPSGASLVFNARVPDTADFTCTASPNIDLSSPTTVSLPGPGVARAGTAGSLSHQTTYFWRCTTTNGDGRFVAQGSATTL